VRRFILTCCAVGVALVILAYVLRSERLIELGSIVLLVGVGGPGAFFILSGRYRRPPAV